MEDKDLVLKVVLHDDGSLEVKMGAKSDSIGPLMLVGIIEQMKHNILASLQVEEISQSTGKYDA